MMADKSIILSDSAAKRQHTLHFDAPKPKVPSYDARQKTRRAILQPLEYYSR